MAKLTSKNIAGKYLVVPFEVVNKAGETKEDAFFIRIPENRDEPIWGVDVKYLVDQLKETGDSDASSS